MQHIRVKVTAGASREHIAEEDGELHLFVKEPPQDNMANRRVVQIIAKRFSVSASRVRIVSGHKARNKTLSISD
ncbi:MAG: DUF167 domain-containing protein [Parcubacteria group bacterium]|nr:DUF167 domain-containing protein [Parcubacteria group bacterium]